jgi:hypothetical protein
MPIFNRGEKMFPSGRSTTDVIAGLVPAISIRAAQLCRGHRDGRDKPDKPGHDDGV